MAKTCDLMVQDTLSPSRALIAAVERGEALQKAEEGFAPVMFSKRKIGTLEEIPVMTGTVTAKGRNQPS